MQNSTNILTKRISKAIIDLLLLVGLVLSILSAHRSADNASWGSFHCVVSITWYVLMLVHIGQHWRMCKSLLKRKVFMRNIITSLTAIAFILMTLTIVLFITKINDQLIHIHHITAHIFWAIIILHLVMKAKRFVSLLKKHS